MFRFDAEKAVSFCDGMRRRDFLHVGALSMLGLSMTDAFKMKAEGAIKTDSDKNCIMLFLVGGPSQLDTWDMKPHAPANIRGPYRPIKTNVSGIEISEIFPRMAQHADKYALIRGLHHSGSAVHDAGHQLMQTGRLFEDDVEHPHFGCVVSKLRGNRGDVPAHIVLPQAIGATGGNLPHGQSAGILGKSFEPMLIKANPEAHNFNASHLIDRKYIAAIRNAPKSKLRAMVDNATRSFEACEDARLRDEHFHQAYTLMTSARTREAFDLSQESDAMRDRYGRNRFGQSALLARRLIERGVRFVTVNMFETVFNEITWDIHGNAPFGPIESYSQHVGPMYDNAYSSLLEDLHERGLLQNTLVVSMGEFGRTPEMNPLGGRDHWTDCWTMMMAGCGIKGGQVIGSSDEIGAYPKDRPTTPAEVAATIYKALDIDLKTEIACLNGESVKVVDEGVQPIDELF